MVSQQVDKGTFTCGESELDNLIFTKADTDAMVKACKSMRKK